MALMQRGATRSDRKSVFLAALLSAALLVAAGCGPGSGPVIGLTSDDPAGRIPAIKQAGERKDAASVAQLVTLLQSDDPAERFYAIEALRRITGETLGFTYYGSEQERSEAVARWKAFAAPSTAAAKD